MKRFLRPITLLVGLALLTPALAPAQNFASVADDPVRKLRGEYERLLAIERAPDTPPDVRAINRGFLEERRAQLQALLKSKIESLHKYKADADSILSAAEKLRVEQTIGDLEKELQALGGEVMLSAPRSESASSGRSARSGRRSRVNRSSTAAVIRASASASALDAAPTRAATPEPTPEPTPSPSPSPSPTPIVFVSPSADKTVNVKEYQIEVNVPDQKIKELMVSVYRPGATEASSSRTLPLGRGDTGASQVVTLVKGANRIVVEDKSTMSESDLAKKKKAEVTLTYEPPKDVPLGATGGASGGILNATPTDKFTNVPEVGENVRVGYLGEADKLYQFFVTKKDGTRQDAGSPTARGLNGTVTAVFPELEEGDRVGVVQIENGEPVPGTIDTIAVELPIDPTKGGPFGLMLGGVVMSQQAQQFGQSDPFFGFIAGYDFKVKNAYEPKKTCGMDTYTTTDDGLGVDEDGFVVKCRERDHKLLYKRQSDSEFVEWNSAAVSREARRDVFVRSTARPKKNGAFRARRPHLRFQGIFQADPRQAEATETATTEGGAQTNEPFKFIASRKTFDVEMHGWIDFWANNMFTLGPYAAIGASTVLDKNELQGEAVTAQAQTGEGSNPDADTVATNAQSDNDIKKYYEFGFLSNTQLFNRKLFIQSILAYGNYEALAGLYEGHNTKHRFIGKLRIFPAGLSREFGRQIQAAPMFGVDLNAGRGPDHLKFFTGFAVRIRGINTN